MDNVQILKRALTEFGLRVAGGEDATLSLGYKHLTECHRGSFFDKLLYEAHIVGTPGIGFGPSGEGYMRFTGFGQKRRLQGSNISPPSMFITTKKDNIQVKNNIKIIFRYYVQN